MIKKIKRVSAACSELKFLVTSLQILLKYVRGTTEARMRIIIFFILSLMFAQAVAAEITLNCQYKVQSENIGTNAYLKVDVEREYINYANWGEPSTIIDWGERYIRWVQNQNDSVGIFVFDRNTSMMLAEVVGLWDFDLIFDKDEEQLGGEFGYYTCAQKAF
jgi:hypothetical protein